MKIADKYYEKIYKQTEKLTKKLFKQDITGCMAMKFQLKQEIEDTIDGSIAGITVEDIYKNKLGYNYAKYRTLSKILEILESACTFKTFTIEELER